MGKSPTDGAARRISYKRLLKGMGYRAPKASRASGVNFQAGK